MTTTQPPKGKAPDPSSDETAFEAACRVLDSEGRAHGWWPTTVAPYPQPDTIARQEFEAVVDRVLLAGHHSIASGEGVGVEPSLGSSDGSVLPQLMAVEKIERVLRAFADLAADPGLWRALTDQPPSAHVALELIDGVIEYARGCGSDAPESKSGDGSTLKPLASGEEPSEEEVHAANGEIVMELRMAASRVTGGNCAFADDDLAILEHLAQRAIDAGLSDGLAPDVKRHVETPHDHREIAKPRKTWNDLLGERGMGLTDQQPIRPNND